MPSFKSLRPFLKSLAFLALLTAVLLCAGAAVLFWLKTEAGGQYVLRQVKAAAQGSGLELQYEPVQFSPLSVLKFAHFKFSLPDGSFRFSAKAIATSYGFKLFPPRLVVERLELTDPSVTFKKKVPELSKVELERSDAEFRALLAEFEKALKNIPFPVSIRELQVRRLNAGIEYATPTLAVRLELPEISFESKALLSADEVLLAGKLDAMRAIGLSFTQGRFPEKLELALAARGKMDLNFTWKQERGQWRYALDIPASDFQVSNLGLTQANAETLRTIKFAELTASLKSRVTAQSARLFQFHGKVIDDFELTAGLRALPAEFAQKSGKKQFLLTLGPQEFKLNGKRAEAGEGVEVLLDYVLKEVRGRGIPAIPSPLRASGKLALDDALSGLTLSSNGTLGGKPGAPAWSLEADVKAQGPFSAKGSLVLRGLLKTLATLEPRLGFTLEIPGSFSNFLEVASALSAAEGLRAKYGAELGVLDAAAVNPAPVQAFQVSGDVQLSPREQRGTASWRMQAGAYLKEFLKPDMWRKFGAFQRAQARGEVEFSRRGDRLEGCFNNDLSQGLLKASGEWSGTLSRKDFLAQGKVEINLPSNLTEFARGALSFPWRASVGGGREIMVSGDLALDSMGLAFGPYAIQGVSGKFKVSEKFVWDGSAIHFAHLLTQNPFERVDYEKVRPLLNGVDQLRIERLNIEDKTLGPLVGFFSLEQNRFSAHQFDVSLGSTGRSYGELFFDFLPSNLQFAVLARVTALNLKEVLPERYLKRLPKGDQEVSARTCLVSNITHNTLDGRVDVTRIGGTQLMTLVNVLDPLYENDRMNLARTALGVGYPTFVGMAFRRGFLDLSMDLSILGASTRYDVRGIPLASMMSLATSDLVKTASKGPLQ